MSVTMTGTGTQNDPFVPYEWDDFVTAIGTFGAFVELPIVPIKTKDEHIMSGKLYFDSTGNRIQSPVESELSNYYENGFVLDANVYAPMGIRLDFEGVTVDGNGASILNCYVPNESCGLRAQGNNTYKLTTLKNLNFLNIYSQSTNYYGFISSSGTRSLKTENVQFQGTIVTGTFFGINGNKVFISTAFSITFGQNAKLGSKYLNDSDNYYQFCLFDFYGNPTVLFDHDQRYGSKFLNCKMTGKLTGTSGDKALFLSDATSTSCVMDIDVMEYTGVSFAYTGTNPYIINTDKIPTGITYGNMTGVTSEQMLDAAYLQSINFPVGG